MMVPMGVLNPEESALTHARIDPSRLRTSVKPSLSSSSAYLPLLRPAVLQQSTRLHCTEPVSQEGCASHDAVICSIWRMRSTSTAE